MKKEMQTEELENKIHDYIIKLYKAKYTRRLEVTHENGIYTLTLGIPDDVIPTAISFQTEDSQEFLEYIYEELRIRNYMRVYFYQVRKKNNLTKYEI